MPSDRLKLIDTTLGLYYLLLRRAARGALSPELVHMIERAKAAQHRIFPRAYFGDMLHITEQLALQGDSIFEQRRTRLINIVRSREDSAPGADVTVGRRSVRHELDREQSVQRFSRAINDAMQKNQAGKGQNQAGKGRRWSGTMDALAQYRHSLSLSCRSSGSHHEAAAAGEFRAVVEAAARNDAAATVELSAVMEASQSVAERLPAADATERWANQRAEGNVSSDKCLYGPAMAHRIPHPASRPGAPAPSAAEQPSLAEVQQESQV